MSFVISGCKKEYKTINNPYSKLISQTNFSKFSIPTPPLDWENIDFMPQPYQVGQAKIPMPWARGFGGVKIDDDIIFDYKSADGWELFTNTFSSEFNADPLYFVLYNKYRGLLRLYFYISPGGNYASDNILHRLSLRGGLASSTPLLNFASQNVVDIDSNNLYVSELQPFKVSTTGSWYASEFEVAYDENIKIKNFQQLFLNWEINSNSLANVTLNGKETGTISGTITSSSNNPSFFGSTANSFVNAGAKFGTKSLLGSSFKFLEAAERSKILDAITSGAAGIVKGFLSGILGGSTSTTEQKVSLKINTEIKTTGTVSIGSQLFDTNYSLPSTLGIENGSGFQPIIKDPIGLFYINAKPVVKKVIDTRPSPITGQSLIDYSQTYTLDNNSFQIVFNNSVNNYADFKNVKKELIMFDNNFSSTFQIVNGIKENVGNIVIYSTDENTIGYQMRGVPRPIMANPKIGVRVSFDVVPKNGAPTNKIIKTFWAKII